MLRVLISQSLLLTTSSVVCLTCACLTFVLRCASTGSNARKVYVFVYFIVFPCWRLVDDIYNCSDMDYKFMRSLIRQRIPGPV